MTEVGVAYVNIIPKADGFSSAVADASKEAGTQGAQGIRESLMGSLRGTFGDLFGTGGEMGGKLAGGMESFLAGAGKLAIVGAVAAIGVEALKELESIGAEIDAMTDTIIVGTGAAGEELAALKQNAMSVAQDVPVGFAKSGDIIQDFATRLNLSGEELQTVATRAAQLDSVIGGFNYDNMARMFNVWSVGADDMNTKMDYMFGVSQNTGIGFDQLTSIMQTAGPTLQNLGFSFEESANMAGLLDKAGIDASSTMSKMSKALVELSEPGESAQDAFRRVVGEMEGYIEAGDTAAAMDLATELFGTRGAAQFIGALQSGAMNMDALADASLGATGNIEGTFEATKSWPEQWALIKTRVQAALEPLGSAVFKTLGDLLEGISTAMDMVWQASEPLRAKFEELAAGAGERLQPVLEALQPILQAIADNALPVLGAMFEDAAAKVDLLATAISFIWDNILVPFAEFVSSTFSAVSSDIQMNLETAATVGSSIVDGFTALMSGDFSGAAQAAATAFESIRSNIEQKLGNAKSFVISAADYIGQVLGFPGLGATVAGVFDSVEHFIEDPIGSARDFISKIPDQIVGFFEGLGNRITSAIGSIHFPTPNITWDDVDVAGVMSMRLPTIQWYARGGIVDSATLIGAGEAGPEMILPKSGGLMTDFAEAVASADDDEQLIRWLSRNLGAIIHDNAPTISRRDFDRMARGAVV